MESQVASTLEVVHAAPQKGMMSQRSVAPAFSVLEVKAGENVSPRGKKMWKILSNQKF